MDVSKTQGEQNFRGRNFEKNKKITTTSMRAYFFSYAVLNCSCQNHNFPSFCCPGRRRHNTRNYYFVKFRLIAVESAWRGIENDEKMVSFDGFDIVGCVSGSSEVDITL